MATLNIENFPDVLYERLQERAEREQRSLAQQVIHLLEASVGQPTSQSILELRGLGKELWNDIDPLEHVRAERNSWARNVPGLLPGSMETAADFDAPDDLWSRKL